ncbi:Dabb family protein (plasmid) [Polymorphobacter sp. PAMC 29334]|uniref:Dabb family protein n=1 Tax=Polymorphobacter sp. PAMC 29334 TaxID=2862331 RepID=UPI001C66BFAA|nr:Dabb family protein [Polymorphobacter sp. PAMC 29334]QYE37102.1 Dabb family protein [Polymorphobacter sp. PAMC 29334]
MITHIVIFRWIGGTTAEQVASVRGALDRLASELVDLASISHGPDLGMRDGNGDYALVAKFANSDGWGAYQGHPAHQVFVRDFVAPIQASRITVQF